MLPLQPKLLPGYNLQSSYLSSTLSTVRPPDLDKDFKPTVEVIVEKAESDSSKSCQNSESSNQKLSSLKSCELDSDSSNQKSNSQKSYEIDSDSVNHNNVFNNLEINSNIIDNKESTVSDLNDDSPNNNSY